MKRNPITSSKHNNTMFIGILLNNIFNEISKRKDEYPVPLISGSGTAPKEGLKGGFAARLYNVHEKESRI